MSPLVELVRLPHTERALCGLWSSVIRLLGGGGPEVFPLHSWPQENLPRHRLSKVLITSRQPLLRRELLGKQTVRERVCTIAVRAGCLKKEEGVCAEIRKEASQIVLVQKMRKNPQQNEI